VVNTAPHHRPAQTHGAMIIIIINTGAVWKTSERLNEPRLLCCDRHNSSEGRGPVTQEKRVVSDDYYSTRGRVIFSATVAIHAPTPAFARAQPANNSSCSCQGWPSAYHRLTRRADRQSSRVSQAQPRTYYTYLPITYTHTHTHIQEKHKTEKEKKKL
jgi:hypothetical protein